MPGGKSGNGWVTCAQGHQHWGLFGAAGVLVYVAEPDPLVLLQHRAKWSHQGGTWALPGGALDSEETPAEGALREADEEVMLDPRLVVPRARYTDDHGGWAYHTVLAQAATPVKVRSDDYESDAAAWRPASQVDQLDLHPGFAAGWPVLRQALAPLTVFVDGTGFADGTGFRDAADVDRGLYAQLSALTRSGIGELPRGVALPALARWYPDYVLLLDEVGVAAVASAGAAEEARRASAKPPMPWNEPLAVRTAEIRTVPLADGGRAAEVLAELAGNTPGHHFTADLNWLLRALAG